MAAQSIGITKFAEQVLLGLFPDISGAYIVEFINNPLRYDSFREFLQKVGIQAADEANLKANLQAIQDQGLLPSADESLQEYNQRLASDPCTPARIRVFQEDDIMTILAVSVARDSVGPGMAGYAVDAAIDGINAYRWENPTTPLIYYILGYIQ